jgi:hypothetical protein
MKYEPDSIIVIKNLQTEILNQPTRLIEEYNLQFNIPNTEYIEQSEPKNPDLEELISRICTSHNNRYSRIGISFNTRCHHLFAHPI